MKKKLFSILTAILLAFPIYANAIELVTNTTGVGASEGYANRISGSKSLWTPAPDSILTTQGDILFRSSDTTLLKRLPAGTSGYFLKTQGAAADPVWAAVSAHQASKVSDANNRTTTSASFEDLTAMSITITTGANPVLIGFTGAANHDQAIGTQYFGFTVSIDGSNEGGARGIITANSLGAGVVMPISLTYQSAALTAASHTFKIRWLTSAATATMLGGNTATKMWVLELK